MANETKLLKSAPYLPVADVNATGDYYSRVLGFSLDYAGGEPPEFAIYSRDGCAIMFRKVFDPAEIRPMESQGGTWDAFFWVADMQTLYEELVGTGAKFAYQPIVQPYGMKEFAVRDPDGHVLGFGQVWPPAEGP